MRNEKNDNTASINYGHFPCPNNNDKDGLSQNIFAVSVAQILYEGKSKEQIIQTVNLLHLLIALAKSYC